MTELAGTIGFALGDGQTFGVNEEYIHLFKPHRPPMVLLDGIVECSVAKKELYAYKEVRLTDPYVAAHFPEDPLMPDSFVSEALAQTCGCLMNILYLAARGVRFDLLTATGFRALTQPPYNVLAETKLKYSGFAVPGDRLSTYARTLLQRQEATAFKVEAKVRERVVASGEMILAYPPYTPLALVNEPEKEQASADR